MSTGFSNLGAAIRGFKELTWLLGRAGATDWDSLIRDAGKKKAREHLAAHPILRAGHPKAPLAKYMDEDGNCKFCHTEMPSGHCKNPSCVQGSVNITERHSQAKRDIKEFKQKPSEASIQETQIICPDCQEPLNDGACVNPACPDEMES